MENAKNYPGPPIYTPLPREAHAILSELREMSRGLNTEAPS
ncbi:MAG TPA: hypothetical protein VE226_03125 [Nitrososphaeraceae archaeon]|nr:hypothetical protein [Nitrososphaeraceae archaeon]